MTAGGGADSGGDDAEARTRALVAHDEALSPDLSVPRQTLPHEERTRRSLLIGLTIAFVASVLLQLGFASFSGDELWGRVSPVLSTITTLVGVGFGAAFGFYFAQK